MMSGVMSAVDAHTLRTERLVLRPWSVADAEAVLAYAADPEFSRYNLAVPYPYARSEAEEFVARVSIPRDGEVDLAVTCDGGAPFGGVTLSLRPDARGELGWSIARAEWGRGYATEAATAVRDWGFESLRLEKLLARLDPRNVASRRVAEKLGMRLEGTLRGGGRADELAFGLWRSEWQSAR
jgi:[ribosomal protein S5]-alanine N-acetyltransferase